MAMNTTTKLLESSNLTYFAETLSIKFFGDTILEKQPETYLEAVREDVCDAKMLRWRKTNKEYSDEFQPRWQFTANSVNLHWRSLNRSSFAFISTPFLSYSLQMSSSLSSWLWSPSTQSSLWSPPTLSSSSLTKTFSITQVSFSLTPIGYYCNKEDPILNMISNNNINQAGPLSQISKDEGVNWWYQSGKIKVFNNNIGQGLRCCIKWGVFCQQNSDP